MKTSNCGEEDLESLRCENEILRSKLSEMETEKNTRTAEDRELKTLFESKVKNLTYEKMRLIEESKSLLDQID